LNKPFIKNKRILFLFRVYYGDYSIKRFKKFIKKIIKKNKGDAMTTFLFKLESRLDILLYRLNFFKNPRQAKHFVKNKSIIINKKLVKILSSQININDVIEIQEKYKNYFRRKILKRLDQKVKRIIFNYPKYVYMDYKLFKCIFIKYPKKDEIPSIVKFN